MEPWVTKTGSFLRELSMVERTQEKSIVSDLSFAEDHVVAHFSGLQTQLPLEISREQIVETFRNQGIETRDAFRGEPDSVIGDPDAHELWCELLDDLGTYSKDLSHADPLLRFLEIHRDPAVVKIVVGNGVRQLTHEVKLNDEEIPAAVTVDIAGEFGASA